MGTGRVLAAAMAPLGQGADHVKVFAGGGAASPTDPLEGLQPATSISLGRHYKCAPHRCVNQVEREHLARQLNALDYFSWIRAPMYVVRDSHGGSQR